MDWMGHETYLKVFPFYGKKYPAQPNWQQIVSED